MNLPKRLKNLREKKEETQKNLAEVIGCAQSTISAWEHGHLIPPADIIEKYSQHFGVTTDYIVKGVGEPDEIVNVSFYNDTNTIDKEEIPIPYSFIKPYKPEDVRALRVFGDSMKKISIYSGDIVFFIHDSNPSDGIYVLSSNNNDKLFVRRLAFDIIDQKIQILSENDSNYSEILKDKEKNQLKITGKVIAWITRYPF